MKITKKLNSIPNWIYITLSICLIITAVIVSFNRHVKTFEELSETSLNYLDQAYEENYQLTKTASNDFLSDHQKAILLRKISIIEKNKLHHIDLMKNLSKNNYALLTLFPFLSAITAILVFLIIQKGWNSSNLYLKTYFILFTTLTSLIGVYSEVYKQSSSIERHTKNYLEYTKIQKTIFNYSLTAPLLEKELIPFYQFIDQINFQENKLTTLIFSIEKKALDEEMFKFGK